MFYTPSSSFGVCIWKIIYNKRFFVSIKLKQTQQIVGQTSIN